MPGRWACPNTECAYECCGYCAKVGQIQQNSGMVEHEYQDQSTPVPRCEACDSEPHLVFSTEPTPTWPTRCWISSHAANPDEEACGLNRRMWRAPVQPHQYATSGIPGDLQ